jgi:hypothetical protein
MSKLTNINDYIDEEVSPIVVLWMSQRCQPKLGNTSFGMKEKMYKMLIKLMDVKCNPKMRNKTQAFTQEQQLLFIMLISYLEMTDNVKLSMRVTLVRTYEQNVPPTRLNWNSAVVRKVSTVSQLPRPFDDHEKTAKLTIT